MPVSPRESGVDQLSSSRAYLTGIHTSQLRPKQESALRLVQMGRAPTVDDDEPAAMPVRLDRYDASKGQLVIEFCDPTSARLVASLCGTQVRQSA